MSLWELTFYIRSGPAGYADTDEESFCMQSEPTEEQIQQFRRLVCQRIPGPIRSTRWRVRRIGPAAEDPGDNQILQGGA